MVGPPIRTSRPTDAPRRSRCPSFMEFSQYWSKTTWTCTQLFEKSGAVKMLYYFSERSPKILVPADFDICIIAMPSMITTVGLGNAVSC